MSMLATLLGLSMIAAPKAPAQVLFSDPNTGFRFVIPANWQVENKKVRTVFYIPFGKDKKSARIELLDTNFRQSAETFQSLQAQVAKDGGNQLVRQWSEEFLGVPMLMTRVLVKAKAGETHLTVAMFYSANDKKMLFRMVTPVAYTADVENMWRQSMLSLTPLNGKLPSPESVDRPIEPPDKQGKKGGRTNTTVIPIENTPEQPRKPVVINPEKQTPKKVVIKAQPVAMKAAGRAVNLLVPEGWKAVKMEDGEVSLMTTGLSMPVRVWVQSPLDSPDAERMLVVGPSATLELFSKVSREDRGPTRNAANANVRWVIRRGEVKGESAAEVYVTGEVGEFYWYLTYRRQPSTNLDADLKLIQRLVDGLTVEQVKS